MSSKPRPFYDIETLMFYEVSAEYARGNERRKIPYNCKNVNAVPRLQSMQRLIAHKIPHAY